MKRKAIGAVILSIVLFFSNVAVADIGDIVFEDIGWILGTDGDVSSFNADIVPFNYLVTLSDLSETPNFGFDSLFLAITTDTSVVGSLVGPGQFAFTAIPGETYFVNVFGEGGGELDAGLYGVEIKTVPPLEPDDLLWFFSESIADGTISGNGPGNSANGRLNAFSDMLEMAANLFDSGDTDGACDQLNAAIKKCDGASPPPDFVKGEAATELHNMILELMETLGCE